MEEILSELPLKKPGTGRLLIAEPYLPDPNFNRTVIFLTEHNDEAGSVGFVLNRPLDVKLNDIVDLNINFDVPVYLGGPVQQDTLHILHRVPKVGNDDLEVIKGVFWGADFQAMKLMFEKGDINLRDFRFFLGYSGWAKGQLDQELEQKSWIVTNSNQDIIFSLSAAEMWQNVLKEMGGNFSFLANSPDNPQWN